MLAQIRTEQLLTRLVLGQSLTKAECWRLRGYLQELTAQLIEQEVRAQEEPYGSLQP